MNPEKVLVVWDAESGSSRRRAFYKKLSGYSQGDYYYPGVLDELPEQSWNWINRSTLVVEKEEARKVRELLSEFDDVLDWHEFIVVEQRA